MTNADRILEVLRTSSRPLDDDELARRCGIQPRQQVNQICLRLEAEGDLVRTAGPDGKLVNAIREQGGRRCLCGCGEATGRNYRPGHDARHAGQVGRALAQAPDLTVDQREALLHELPSLALREKASKMGQAPGARTPAPGMPEGVRPPRPVAPTEASGALGSSHEQQDAQDVMLDLLGERLGATLLPRRLVHSSGAYVEVDGASPDLSVLVECWAHQGTAKVAQKYKLVNDATKLSWIAKSLEPRPERLILCVSDELAVAHLRGTSWQGAAIRDLGVEIEVVDLPADLTETIRAAQKRQYR